MAKTALSLILILGFTAPALAKADTRMIACYDKEEKLGELFEGREIAFQHGKPRTYPQQYLDHQCEKQYGSEDHTKVIAKGV